MRDIIFTMKVFWFLLSLVFFAPLISFAQGVPGISTPISIDMSPTNPGPNETVTLTATSYSFNIDSSLITWMVNGSVVSHGLGDKTLTLSSGPLGKQTTVTLSAQVPSLGLFTGSENINPALVNLVWEAQTSVPPFYQGKALLGWGATYKVVAVPQVYENGTLVNPSHLVYTWSKDYSVDSDQSGYGKDTYQSDGSINYTLGGDTVSLSVATTDGSATAQGSVDLSPITPSILIYPESPIYGILYNQSVSQTSLSGDSISLHAEPFFFSDISSAIGSLIWTINGTTAGGFAGNPSITLVRQDPSAGISVVGVSLQSPTAMLQGAQGSVTINIDAKK